MRFLWPEMLWLLLALPLLVAAYLFVLARRKKAAVVYSSLALPMAAMGPRQRLRRHIPPALFLLALAAALLACARPVATVTLPSDSLTVVLVMDVSRSMDATDVLPTRLEAARQAAADFIGQLPSSVRLGIVSFAATAAVVQPPTDNRQNMLEAIGRFELQRGTATGNGLILGLSLLFPDQSADLESLLLDEIPFGLAAVAIPLDGSEAREAARRREQERPAVPPGSYANGAIILLSDGRRTTGPDPADIAQLAARRGVRIYSVGFGAPPANPGIDGGLSYWMQLDEPSLRAVANLTGGEYFQAGSASDLSKVYRNLSTRFALEHQRTEIGALLAALAALLLAIAGGLSLLWFRR